MAVGDSRQVETSKSSGFKYAAATLFVVALTSTVAQYIAAASLNLADDFVWEPSTGGLVALIAAISMWVKCRSWDFWTKWIWLWVGITVIIAFIVINAAATQSLVPSVNDQPVVEETGAAVTQACVDMHAELQAQARMIEEYRSAPENDWRHFLWENSAASYYQEFDELNAEYSAAC